MGKRNLEEQIHPLRGWWRVATNRYFEWAETWTSDVEDWRCLSNIYVGGGIVSSRG